MAVLLSTGFGVVVSSAGSIVQFQHVTAVRPTGGIAGVSFELRVGEVYAWLGGPGSGKTTIVDLVLGFAKANAGTVQVDGIDPGVDATAARNTTGFVDGRARFAGPMTPRGYVHLFAKLAGLNSLPEERTNALRLMGLQDRYLARSMAGLPHAAHCSVMLAWAWLRRPPLLLLDDPTAGFDSLATARFIEIVGEFRRAGTSVLLTTSDVLVAAQLGDHIGVLKRGEKVAERHRHQLLQESLTALYSDYVGRSYVKGHRP